MVPRTALETCTMAQIVREITIGGSITQQSVAAGAAKKYFTRLQAGYIYQVVSAYLYADCSVNVAAGSNLTAWYLADASGNTIASINATAATTSHVLQAGSTMGTPVAAYKTIDCTAGAGALYLTHQSSGEGQSAAGIRCVVLLNVYRPPTAA
jgi:hypothetical protein